MTLVWFYTAQESRYLIQVYLIAAIFGVAGWEAVVRNVPRITRPLAALVVAVSVLYGLFMITTGRIEDVRSVISSAYAERRRQAEIPFLASYRYLNSDPSVGKVLVLDSFVPSYYLDKDYLKPLGRHGEQAMPGIQSAGDALADLQKWRITHVLDVQWEDGKFKVPENPKDLTLVFEANGQRIYRVVPAE